MTALRDRVFASSDQNTELVEVPEWGETFLVKSLEAGQRNAVIQEATTEGPDGESKMDLDTYYSRIIQMCTYDPESTDERVFAEDDVTLLLARNPKALDRLSLTAMRLSGMDKDGLDASVAAAGKGSSSTESADSSSR